MNRQSMILDKMIDNYKWSLSDDEGNFNNVREKLNFLMEYLKLNTLETELLCMEYKGEIEKLNGSLTGRQVKCIEFINLSIQKNDIKGAYRELYKFIESYNDLNDKPINIIERIVIKNVIYQIEASIERINKLNILDLLKQENIGKKFVDNKGNVWEVIGSLDLVLDNKQEERKSITDIYKENLFDIKFNDLSKNFV